MNDTLKNELRARQNVLLIGPPGCGKTARILAAAKSQNFRVVTWRASLMERVDISGCIVPDHAAGVSAQLPFADVAELRKCGENTLLFVDDLGQAPVDVQAALMRLFDGEFLPENVVVWAATNRPGDKAGVNSLCEPLRSRFHAAYVIPTLVLNKDGVWKSPEDSPAGGVLLGNWSDELDGWLSWAMDNDAAPEIVAWHRSTNGKSLYNWLPCADPSVRMADFRSWGALIRRWNCGLRDLSSVAAVVGKPAAGEFLAFAKLADKLPSPDQVWLDPLGAMVPPEPSSQYLICTALAGQVGASTAPAFIKYIARFPRMFAALAAKDAYRRLGATLSGCKDWVQWFTDNRSLFEVGN